MQRSHRDPCCQASSYVTTATGVVHQDHQREKLRSVAWFWLKDESGTDGFSRWPPWEFESTCRLCRRRCPRASWLVDLIGCDHLPIFFFFFFCFFKCLPFSKQSQRGFFSDPSQATKSRSKPAFILFSKQEKLVINAVSHVVHLHFTSTKEVICAENIFLSLNWRRL